MSFEMSCANCEGRLMVDSLGIVVECPHCGTHLAIPEEIPGLPGDAAVPPESEESDGHALDEEDEDHDEHFRGDDDGTAAKSTWFPEKTDEVGPDSFPDFSKLGKTSSSESNVLVSEPNVQIESEVPSAIRVLNPDPSGVIPAIVTDSRVSGPISSLPAIVSDSHSKTQSDEEHKTDSEETKAVTDEPAASIPSFQAKPDEDEESGFPAFGSSPALAAAAASPKPAATESQPKPSPRKEPAQSGGSVLDAVYGSRRGRFIPKVVFQAWLSYTILLTAGLAMAIYYIFTVPTSNLESLPDVKPVEKSGKVVRNLVPEKAAMPPGHTLAMEKTQRFGNIEVTPLKVTKGELELIGQDYVEESRRHQSHGQVLKLWLKFKNVSKDQVIAPLDNELLFFRDPRADRTAGALANNFVCGTDDKHEQGHIVLVYDHWVDGDYDLKNQNLGKELKPGEEVTIYIPTEPQGWEKLQGDLIWRVHVRKGYSPSNYGVTTIFEVKFNSDNIETDPATA